MKIFLMALLLCAGSAEFAAADSLPVNPWAAQRQTVKISRTGENTQQAAPQTVETPQWVTDRVEAVRRNNERVRAEYEAMEKAEALMQQQAVAAAAAQNSDSGFLDKLGRFFSDDKKTAACFLFRNVARMERCVRKRELAEKSSYARMNRIFMKCVPHFLLLKELSFKEKLFYISKFISNYFKYKFKNI